MRRRQRPEQTIHRAVVQQLNTRATPGVVYLHPANGGARSPIEAAILKSLGVVPGAPDLILFHDGKSFALELKSEDGRPTEAQLAMIDRLSAAGVYTASCHGIDPALRCLET